MLPTDKVKHCVGYRWLLDNSRKRGLSAAPGRLIVKNRANNDHFRAACSEPGNQGQGRIGRNTDSQVNTVVGLRINFSPEEKYLQTIACCVLAFRLGSRFESIFISLSSCTSLELRRVDVVQIDSHVERQCYITSLRIPVSCGCPPRGVMVVTDCFPAKGTLKEWQVGSMFFSPRS